MFWKPCIFLIRVSFYFIPKKFLISSISADKVASSTGCMSSCVQANPDAVFPRFKSLTSEDALPRYLLLIPLPEMRSLVFDAFYNFNLTAIIKYCGNIFIHFYYISFYCHFNYPLS